MCGWFTVRAYKWLQPDCCLLHVCGVGTNVLLPTSARTEVCSPVYSRIALNCSVASPAAGARASIFKRVALTHGHKVTWSRLQLCVAVVGASVKPRLLATCLGQRTILSAAAHGSNAVVYNFQRHAVTRVRECKCSLLSVVLHNSFSMRFQIGHNCERKCNCECVR